MLLVVASVEAAFYAREEPDETRTSPNFSTFRTRKLLFMVKVV
jgi:hypothetical protein